MRSDFEKLIVKGWEKFTPEDLARLNPRALIRPQLKAIIRPEVAEITPIQPQDAPGTTIGPKDKAKPGKGWSKGAQFVPRSTCEECGALFYVSPFHKKRKGGRFCSNNCYGLSMSRRNAPNLTRVNCQRCGKEFTIPPSHQKRGGGKFCSKKCAEKPLTTCQSCGKQYKAYGAFRKYCSAACYQSVPRGKPPEIRICEACQEPYELQAGSRGRFCSIHCYAGVQAKERSDSGRTGSYGRGGRRADLNNQYFRSRWEANWARYLNWLKAQGQIKDWKYEPKTFEFTKIKRGSKFYTPDFFITNPDDSVEWHEVKGYMDQRSATKLKRMARYFPDERIIVIAYDAYHAVQKMIGGAIPHWETAR